MEAKLIKVENTFYLKQDGTILGTSSYPNLSASIGYSLSLKNCEAIANGYDLDELAKKHYNDHIKRGHTEEDSLQRKIDFILGFQKALEILGDKKFSEEDVMSMIEKSRETGLTAQYLILANQQTEWEVIVEMEDIIHLKNRRGGLANMGKPKLDADECLILKRK